MPTPPSKCPKCSSLEMIGPHYNQRGYYPEWNRGDHLTYRCGVCGYIERQPCDDAPPSDAPVPPPSEPRRSGGGVGGRP